MSVLLQGLSTPKGNPRTINIYRDGGWCDAYTTENGKAIEVPPHGRLIDADAFSEEMRKRHKAASDWYDSVEDGELLSRAESTMMAFTECRLTLDAMQTVIEAEDGST